MIKNYSTNPDDNQYIKSINGIINLTEGETIYNIPSAIRKISADLQYYAKDRLFINNCLSNTEELRFERDTLNEYIVYIKPSTITKQCSINGTTIPYNRNELDGYYKLSYNPISLSLLTNQVDNRPIEYCFFIGEVPTGWKDITEQYKDRFIEFADTALQLKLDDVKSHNHTVNYNIQTSNTNVLSNTGDVAYTGKTRGNTGSNMIGGNNININDNVNIVLSTTGSTSKPKHITLRLGVRL